ncbi:MAG: hypothetical protein RTU09_04020 [Candidatus Thorarchaeota archaeon]
MEIPISLAFSGVLILLVTLWRARNIGAYSDFRRKFEGSFDVQDVDLSGETECTHCVSYEWVQENVVGRKHGKLGSALQDHMTYNTLAAAMWIGFFAGAVSLIIGVILVQSLVVIGSATFIIMFGALIALGPGNPKVSDDLLQALQKVEFDTLNKEDYSYVTLAVASIRKWLIISGVIGVAFLMLAPFGDLMPWFLAYAIATFTNYVIWGPTHAIAEFSLPLALLYMAAVLPILLYVVPKLIQMAVRKKKGKKKHASTTRELGQW